MVLNIDVLTAHDLHGVDRLMKRNSATLGFLPRQALLQFLHDGTVLGTKASDGALVAYLLYAKYPDYIRLVHLCVDEQARRRGLAKRLFLKLKQSAETQHEIRLHCRTDYAEAQELWDDLDFVEIGQRPGRSARGTTLSVWQYTLRKPRQADLFRAKLRDVLDVVVDAQILFHLDAPETGNTGPAHELASDWLADAIALCVTDEHFREIRRNPDEAARARSLERAHTMRRLSCEPSDVGRYQSLLASVLPTRKEQDRSDIAHIAYAAASEARTFATQDDRLLRHAATIEDLTGVTILHPTELIIGLHRSANPDQYMQSRVSGLDLAWQRITSADLPEIVPQVAVPGERHGRLRETLDGYLSHPERYTAHVVRSPEGVHALRIIEQRRCSLTLKFFRMTRKRSRGLYADFLVKETLAYAVANRATVIDADREGLAPEVASACLKAGFVTAGGSLSRFCVAKSMERAALEDMLAGLSRPLAEALRPLPPVELATRCTPVDVPDDGSGRYLLPIKPRFAAQLFDIGKAGDDLFGFRQQPLMRWENVYYRAKTHHKMLQAPGWLLWYVSGERQEIVGLSRLDAVEVGEPKEMLRRFRKLGVLDWEDLMPLCRGDVSTEIMCLKFSHTFRFTQAISLAQLREMEGRRRVALQSPRRVGNELYSMIFNAGFGAAQA